MRLIVYCILTLPFQTMNARNMPSIKKVAKEKLRYLHMKKLNTQHKLNIEITRRLVLVTQDLNRVSADEVNYWKQWPFFGVVARNGRRQLHGSEIHAAQRRSLALLLEAGRSLRTVLKRGSEHPSTENKSDSITFSGTTSHSKGNKHPRRGSIWLVSWKLVNLLL